MDCSPPGSSVHRILQARKMEWVAILFSRGSSWPRDQTRVSWIAGGFFTIWATRELPFMTRRKQKGPNLFSTLNKQKTGYTFHSDISIYFIQCNVPPMKNAASQSLSHVQLFATPWTVAHQAPPSLGLSRQDYWSGKPFPTPGDPLDPGIGAVSPASADGFSSTVTLGKPHLYTHAIYTCNKSKTLETWTEFPENVNKGKQSEPWDSEFSTQRQRSGRSDGRREPSRAQQSHWVEKTGIRAGRWVKGTEFVERDIKESFRERTLETHRGSLLALHLVADLTLWSSGIW